MTSSSTCLLFFQSRRQNKSTFLKTLVDMCIKMSTCGNKTENTWNGLKWMSSPVNCTSANILACRYTVRHVEINKGQMKSCEICLHMWTAHFLHIFTCGPKFRLVETKQKTWRNVYILIHMWKCAQMCNSHVKTYISRCRKKTEDTRKHVKWMSSLVSCTFSHIFTCAVEFKYVKINSKCDTFTWEKGHGWRPQESLWLQ